MRVSMANLGLAAFSLALAGCSAKGLTSSDTKRIALDAGAHSRDAAPGLSAEVSLDAGRVDAATSDIAPGDTVGRDGARDGLVAPGDGTNSTADAPGESPLVADGDAGDRPRGTMDSADAVAVFSTSETGNPPDAQTAPETGADTQDSGARDVPVSGPEGGSDTDMGAGDLASPIDSSAQEASTLDIDSRPADGALDALTPDSTSGDTGCALGDTQPDQIDTSVAPDGPMGADTIVIVPDGAPDGNADVVLDAPARDGAQAPVFIASGGGRGPLSTTITTSSTSVDYVPSINYQTVRAMLRTTAAGSQVMIKLTNRYSTQELPIGAAHVAIRSSGGAVAAGSDRTLLFGGSPGVTIAAGAETWSDPVSLSVARGDTLAISVYVNASLTPTTESGRGNLSWMTHYLSSSGDYTSSPTMPAATSGPTTTHTILFVAEVRVLPSGPAATLVTLGDSITEGAASTSPNGDWPDLLSDRLPTLPNGTTVSVFNAGIGSGRFVSSDGAGVRGSLRLNELLQLPQVRWVIVLMGVNDISYEHVQASDLISAYQAAIGKAHAAGVKIMAIPILPFKGSVKDVGTNWATAQTVNAWIRSPGTGFDAIIDFEPVLDPQHTGYIQSSLTSDGVHPNQAGYTAVANSIDLSIFN